MLVIIMVVMMGHISIYNGDGGRSNGGGVEIIVEVATVVTMDDGFDAGNRGGDAGIGGDDTGGNNGSRKYRSW